MGLLNPAPTADGSNKERDYGEDQQHDPYPEQEVHGLNQAARDGQNDGDDSNDDKQDVHFVLPL
jgi:hypothetical protein